MPSSDGRLPQTLWSPVGKRAENLNQITKLMFFAAPRAAGMVQSSQTTKLPAPYRRDELPQTNERTYAKCLGKRHFQKASCCSKFKPRSVGPIPWCRPDRVCQVERKGNAKRMDQFCNTASPVRRSRDLSILWSGVLKAKAFNRVSPSVALKSLRSRSTPKWFEKILLLLIDVREKMLQRMVL